MFPFLHPKSYHIPIKKDRSQKPAFSGLDGSRTRYRHFSHFRQYSRFRPNPALYLYFILSLYVANSILKKQFRHIFQTCMTRNMTQLWISCKYTLYMIRILHFVFINRKFFMVLSLNNNGFYSIYSVPFHYP